jgi:hypothetical protein
MIQRPSPVVANDFDDSRCVDSLVDFLPRPIRHIEIEVTID